MANKEADESLAFLEQAEYLDPETFQSFTVDHPNEDFILNRLTGIGAKVLIGPRGCGKTTLLLKARRRALQANLLPIYVNYKHSLKLEPAYKRSPDGTFLFTAWLTYMAYTGLEKTARELSITLDLGLLARIRTWDSIFRSPDPRGYLEKYTNVDIWPTIGNLEEDIDGVLDATGRQRCVLFFDDAAHSFSQEQQRDFFEFFRSLRSRHISTKAAVYPGVTRYGPSFHVGHDAEEVNVWMKPDEAEYLHFCRQLIASRFPGIRQEELVGNENFEILCYASFGIPRSLLNMLQDSIRGTGAIHLKRSDIQARIKENISQSLQVFRSIALKLPAYKNFISSGEIIFETFIQAVKSFNQKSTAPAKSDTVALTQPVREELTIVLQFLQYSGLVMDKSELKRGEKGTFDLYLLHYSALIDRNALLVQKSIKYSDQVAELKNRSAHVFTRVSEQRAWENLTPEIAFKFDLQNCQKCGASRLNAASKFCHHCGAELKAPSTYEAILDTDISKLSLTESRVKTIKRHSKIRSIRDILLDHEHVQLRGVPRIGPVWAKRITAYAEEALS